MQINLQDPIAIDALKTFTERGVKAGCPYCKGRKIASVEAGDKIVVLKGVDAGRSATVTNTRGWSEDEFFAHFDSDEPGTDTRIHYKRDEFVYAPLEQPPPWLCPLSTDDLCAIENAALKSFLLLVEQPNSTWNARTLLPLVGAVWGRRLPVSGSELVPTFKAHGAIAMITEELARLFDISLQTLILLEGRAPIKKKRMAAMSKGRYLTPTQEQFFGPSPTLTS